MMRMQRRWRWLVIVAGVVAPGWAGVGPLYSWGGPGGAGVGPWAGVGRAGCGVGGGAGALCGALGGVRGVGGGRGGAGGDGNYWLGICEALDGRPEAALRAFARVPAGYSFDPVGAYHEAKANLSQGRLHPAERRLEQALARGGPGLDRIRDLLSHIEQIEVRFDDVKPLLHAGLAAADDPIRDLKELSNFDLERLPYDGLRP